MTTSFRKSLREYAAPIIAEPGDHKRAEIAQAFLDENPELAQAWLRDLAERHVDSLIKDMCSEPAPEQIALVFDGLPAAIAVGPGVVKAIEHCTPDDIEVGRQAREDNIRDAQAKLHSYSAGATKYLTQRRGSETVGQTQQRITS